MSALPRDIIPKRFAGIWRRFAILVFLGVVYILSLSLLAEAGSHYGFSILVAIIFAPGLTGTLHFAILRTLGESNKSILIPSLQVFVLFSAVPYILWLIAMYSPWGRILPGPLGTVMLFLIAVLPELLWFIALSCLKKRLGVPTIIFILLAAAATFELWPMRASFVCARDGAMHRFSDSTSMKPSGKHDREMELKRSLETLNNLAISSEKAVHSGLTSVVLGVPTLDRNPDIFKPDSSVPGLDMREYLISAFERYETTMDTALDSDGDDLSNFREAMLLSNPRLVDTDSDGIHDNEDSDPLNPSAVSRYAEINAAILAHLAEDIAFPLLLVENRFFGGRGEIADFGGHVLVLEENQAQRWALIFQYQLDEMESDSPMLGHVDALSIHVQIGRTLVDPIGRIAVAEVIQQRAGFVFLLVRFGGEWRVAAVDVLWIPM